MRVSLDSTVIGIVATPQFWGWQSQTFTGLATSASTTLKFTALTNDASLDGVKVSWTHEPPAILSQPRSASTYVGGTVSFDVRVKGAPPITYQWLRNQEPVGSAAAALRTFTIPSAVAADAGDYSVLVTNAFGSVTSSVVRLNVEAVAAPVIVLQPYGG
ncbi:MAG TPA: immunoglobulin domain-containing protein, partial [Candidatus Binatia bacterium]|nr:immunoglobulin domain-containing protein [Candidatus Binatia bacterium]